MIITLSPAKIMTFGQGQPALKLSQPVFKEQQDEIISLLRRLSVEELKKLMTINQQLANSVFSQIHEFGTKKAPVSACALAYNGMAYKGLEFSSLSEKEMAYAQTHILIGSALYGWLRPLDQINPYRLEMQAKLTNSRGKTLYDYWRIWLTDYLKGIVSKNGKIWLNLSSDEYMKVVNVKSLGNDIRIITPQFKEETSKGYRQVIVHTKKARGLMARFVVRHQIENPEYLRAFDTDGYCYTEEFSSENELVFIR